VKRSHGQYVHDMSLTYLYSGPRVRLDEILHSCASESAPEVEQKMPDTREDTTTRSIVRAQVSAALLIVDCAKIADVFLARPAARTGELGEEADGG
jgi:hypothetical protein